MADGEKEASDENEDTFTNDEQGLVLHQFTFPSTAKLHDTVVAADEDK